MILVRQLGHQGLFALAKSRPVAGSDVDRAQGRFVALDALAFPAKQPRRVYLRAVPKAVLVTRQVFINPDA